MKSNKLKLMTVTALLTALNIVPMLIGNYSFTMAVIGVLVSCGAAAINSWAPLSLGAIGSFLQLSKQFSMPIAHVKKIGPLTIFCSNICLNSSS